MGHAGPVGINLVDFLQTNAAPFILVFLRASGLFFMTPVFASPEIPFEVRGLLSAALAVILFPFAVPYLPSSPEMGPFLLACLDAVTIGILLGLVVALYQSALLMAGQFYSMQIGFGIVNVIDPLSQEQVPILGQAKSLFGLLLFLGIGGHHLLIESLGRSFAIVPSLTLASSGPLFHTTLRGISSIFDLGFRIAAPIVGTIFLVELILGILSKAAPQMNVLVIGFQGKILIGLMLLIALWPVILQMAGRLYGIAFTRLGETLVLLGTTS